jgi:hypothetical protein
MQKSRVNLQGLGTIPVCETGIKAPLKIKQPVVGNESVTGCFRTHLWFTGHFIRSKAAISIAIFMPDSEFANFHYHVVLEFIFSLAFKR